MVYVLDASALDAIPARCGGQGQCGPLLNALGELVDAQEVCFGPATASELRNLAGDGVHRVWVTERVKVMWLEAPDWVAIQEVAALMQDHVDWELHTEEIELPSVIAHARCLPAAGRVVVTEDTIDKPDLISMVNACGLTGVPSISFDQFAAAAGLDVFYA